MLYGMAEPIKEALNRMAYRVREYRPLGETLPGMAYLVRRLLENTSNEGFLRARFSGNTLPAPSFAIPPRYLLLQNSNPSRVFLRTAGRFFPG